MIIPKEEEGISGAKFDIKLYERWMVGNTNPLDQMITFYINERRKFKYSLKSIIKS